MFAIRGMFFGLCVMVLSLAAFAALGAGESDVASFSAGTFTLEVNGDGQTVALFARGGVAKDGNADSDAVRGGGGIDILDHRASVPFAVLRTTREGSSAISTKAEFHGDMQDLMTVGFSLSDGTPSPYAATFRITPREQFLIVELVEVTGGPWYGLEFAQAPLAVDFPATERFGASTIAMTPGAEGFDMPGTATRRLGGRTWSRVVEYGAKIALCLTDKESLRGGLQSVVAEMEPGVMPVSAAGGPFAKDVAKSRGNYIITSSAITAEEVPEWIDHLKKFGIDQVDFHQGGPFRQGDFAFNKKAYPNDVTDFRRMTDALREEGMIAGLHTYAEFISPQSKYVTPTPHPELDVMRTFTLAAALDAESTTLTVNESTADVSTLTGFFVRNSLCLRIDDELILFGKPSTASPFGFTECTRGAYGTTPSSHDAGASVAQMTHMFGLFAPKAESELFLEIARETARAYNEGGFGMIYLDALDGTYAIVDDPELIGFYDARFVNEIVKNCLDPPLIEYSTMSNNIWLARSRMGAWDSPHRGYRKFFDLHFAANILSADAAFLPGQIGWLAICPSAGEKLDAFQRQILFAEDVHYLGAKSLAHDYGYSFLDIPLSGIKPAAVANGAILVQYNTARRGGLFDTATLEKLRDPSLDVVLFPPTPSEASFRLKTAHYQSFEVADGETFTGTNPDAAQAPYIRIENRYSVAEHADDPPVLVPFDEDATVEPLTTATFDPPLDLSEQLGMGMWVLGDGGGQKINIRVESPAHLISGHNDHFLTVDFCGWRYCTFAEAQNGLGASEEWPIPCGHAYGEFREDVHYKAVSAVHVMVLGETKNLRFRPLWAMPLVPFHLINPTFELDGQRFDFVGKIASGHYLEFDPQTTSANEGVVRDAVGNLVSTAPILGDLSGLPAGTSTVKFSAEKSEEVPVRAKVTLRTLGEFWP